jgi:hypothetical protein
MINPANWVKLALSRVTGVGGAGHTDWPGLTGINQPEPNGLATQR